jgi:hypothetical protein
MQVDAPSSPPRNRCLPGTLRKAEDSCRKRPGRQPHPQEDPAGARLPSREGPDRLGARGRRQTAVQRLGAHDLRGACSVCHSAMASRWKGTLGQRKPGPIVEAWHGKVKPPPLRRRAGRPNPPARLKDGLRLVLDREQRPMAALVACRTLVAPLPLPELCAGNGGVLRRIATSTPVPSRRQRNRLRQNSPPAVILSSFGTTPCVTWEPDRCL